MGLVDAAKKIGNGKVCYSAFSFGGNFAALVGLSGVVDACLDNGGPVNDSFTADHMGNIPFGMFDIVANAVGYDAKPTLDQLLADMATLSRAALLEQQTNCPMYVINGADDYFVAKSDTLVAGSLRRFTNQWVIGASQSLHETAGATAGEVEKEGASQPVFERTKCTPPDSVRD